MENRDKSIDGIVRENSYDVQIKILERRMADKQFINEQKDAKKYFEKNREKYQVILSGKERKMICGKNH